MKKLLQIGAFFCGLLMLQYGNANNAQNQNYQVSECPPVYGGQCPADHAHPDQPAGPCMCLMVHYEPCYYTTQRCVEERVPCTKRCCRYVDKYYEVQRCKYVPQYYTETYCQKEPEYYDAPDCKICKKTVCDQHCKWVPKYYWKQTNNGCAPTCPAETVTPGCCP